MARDRRYSRILSAAKYYSAIDNYLKYITDSTKRGQRVGTGQPRPKSIKYFVDPFGIPLGTNQVVPVTASEPAFNSYKGNLTGRLYEAATITDEERIIPLRNFRAARAIITTGRTTNGTAKTSAVTGMKYLSYGGRSTSIAFGRKTDPSDTFATAAAEVKTALQTAVANSIITIRPEVVPTI